jgi:hypothetical protein
VRIGNADHGIESFGVVSRRHPAYFDAQRSAGPGDRRSELAGQWIFQPGRDAYGSQVGHLQR